MSGDLALGDFRTVADAVETIGYYLNVRLLAHQQGVDANLPLAVHNIAELAAALPKPDPAAWAGLAVGKLPGAKPKPKPKPKPANGEGEAEAEAEGDRRPRTKWTDALRAELVKLVDNAEHRQATLGKAGNHGAAVNWAALARHFSFSGTGPLHRQYKLSTGREPPHATRAKKDPDAPPPGEPAAKKAKPAAVPAAPAPTAAASSDGWTQAQCSKLVRLVEDEQFRKQETGKRHLKWSRVAEALGKGKKESRKKYTAVTGKTVED